MDTATLPVDGKLLRKTTSSTGVSILAVPSRTKITVFVPANFRETASRPNR